jgi:hypothetical protein
MYYYLPFFAPRDVFLGASSKTQPKWGGPLGQPSEVSREAPFAACRYVGQVGRGTLWVRRIVNPPAGSEHNAGESPEKFAACRYAGQPILPAAAFFGASSGHARIFVPSRVQPGLPAPQIVQS